MEKIVNNEKLKFLIELLKKENEFTLEDCYDLGYKDALDFVIVKLEAIREGKLWNN